MTRKRIILIVLLLIGLTAMFAYITRPLSTADCMLIYHNGMNRTEAKHYNGAVFITDKDEISKVEKLFSLNKSAGHACGYHWNISFWTGSTDGEIIPFNQECEEFLMNTQTIHNTLKTYFRQIETNPTHFIYNLKVPTSITPQELIADFENVGLPIFFLNGEEENLPFVTCQYMQVSTLPDTDDREIWRKSENENEQKAKNKMNDIISKVKENYEVEDISDINFPMQGFGRTIEHLAEVTIKFKLGSNLNGLKELLETEGAQVEESEIPTDYFVQLVEKEKDLDKVETKITRDFDYIIDVFKYPLRKENE